MNQTLTPELQAEFEKLCERIPLAPDPGAWSADQWMTLGFMMSIYPVSIELDAWITEQAILTEI